MKKSVKILIFVAIGVIILGVGICALGIAIGGLNLQNYSFGEAVELQTNTIGVKDDFSSVDIDLETGDIYFVPSTDGTASVEAYTAEKAEFSAEVRDGTLYIVCKDGRKWYERISLFGGGKEKLTVTVPAKDYAKLNIVAASSDIHIPADFSFENAAVKCTTGDGEFAADVKDKLSYGVVTGDLDISDTQPNELSVKFNTGDLKMSDINCGSLDVTGITGDIKLSNTVSQKDTNIKNITGDLVFDSCDAQNISVNLTTGDIKGTLLSEKEFKAKATTGDVDVPNTSASGKCEINVITGDINMDIEK